MSVEAKSITVGIKEYKKLWKRIEKTKKMPQAVETHLIGDFKSRAPSWIAKEVTEIYNIKKKEITPSKTNKGKLSSGRIVVRGKRVANISFVYQGRALSPTHFNMTPKTPRVGGYTLKAQVLKSGGKKTLGKVKKLSKKQRQSLTKNFRREGTRSSKSSPIMLMGTGAMGVDKTNYVPFRRQSASRKDIEIIRTLSMPQMVSNKRVRSKIDAVLNKEIGKRLDHYMNRYMR